MPPVEQALTSYLFPDLASSLTLPTKPLRASSAHVGKGYVAAGQAGSCLHTMAVLQVYLADLLKELDEGEGFNVEDISELSFGLCQKSFCQMAKVFLYPRAGYVPKVPSVTPQPVVMQAFSPPPFREPAQQKLYTSTELPRGERPTNC